jgi:hypothetical protein
MPLNRDDADERIARLDKLMEEARAKSQDPRRAPAPAPPADAPKSPPVKAAMRKPASKAGRRGPKS